MGFPSQKAWKEILTPQNLLHIGTQVVHVARIGVHSYILMNLINLAWKNVRTRKERQILSMSNNQYKCAHMDNKVPSWFSSYIFIAHNHQGLGLLLKSNLNMTLMLQPTWMMVLLHHQVILIIYVTSEQTSWELEASWRILLPFQGEHLEWAYT